MTNQLAFTITTVKNDILSIARDLHAHKTFEHELSHIPASNQEQTIVKLVEQIAALNGVVCNGKKILYANQIEKLLFELGDLNAAILTAATIDKETRHKLSDFINRNIVSISRVLKDNFRKK